MHREKEDGKVDYTKQYEELNEIIRTSEHIVFFGGAGVSTESGIPDFRSKDGLYNNRDVQFERYTPEYLLSINCLMDEPNVFYEFYRQKLNVEGIEPNKAHIKLAQMETRRSHHAEHRRPSSESGERQCSGSPRFHIEKLLQQMP